ncbi:thioesterase family protein [uncultured Odoribacter sp.]|uniref:acyl-CoA thioesterase n=1 Tax=uncultured Odoribacter sp. TaxID=876416 RepID=UPI00262A8A71|nr:acyl-CoA thioesterase [uncultured Odoribacter sp.]
MVLTASKEIDVRFNEVDSMGIVWHGSYAKYFEDAREEFGRKYNIGYLRIFGEGFYAPLVKLDFNYKKPLVYGNKMLVEIKYLPTEAAKICFDYRIYLIENGTQVLVATGSSMQVFLDKNYQLIWGNPDFYEAWKKQWQVI